MRPPPVGGLIVALVVAGAMAGIIIAFAIMALLGVGP